MPAGYFACSDLDYIYKQNSKFDCSLLKGYTLVFKSFYPSNDKQNVDLSMAILCEVTVAVSKS